MTIGVVKGSALSATVTKEQEKFVTPAPLPNPEERELLNILAEECNEIAIRVSKLLRFGAEEIQEGQQYTNSERLGHEIGDFIEVRNRLMNLGMIGRGDIHFGIKSKQKQLAKYLQHNGTGHQHDLLQAKGSCIFWHGDQVRKYTGEPYWYHPRNVSRRLELTQMSKDVCIAGWLHDVLEDTDCTEDYVRQEFGENVLRLVLEVTDVSMKSDGDRATRKAMDREHLSKASPEGKTIKLADLIDNTSSIVEHDPDFAKIYLREKEELLKVLGDGDPGLYEIAKMTLSSAKKKLGMS